MDQHPVPQNISSYEFHLVGDMTLKQFFQLSGGIAVAAVLYRLPLPFFLKWPIMALSVLMGIMLAFVPVSGRPFSQWIMAFIKAIYSPTEFHWSEAPQPPATMNHEPTNQVTNNSIPSPDYPNLLTGQVLDSAGSYLEGVILELSDATGLPVRALRSNKLGQFMTATPLPQGTYTLIAEKEGLQFSPLTLQAENKIISPIVIKAQLGSSQLVSS